MNILHLNNNYSKQRNQPDYGTILWHSGIDRYLELIPIHNHWKLDEELDWDNDYDRDLTEIAKGLTNWQTNLRVPLGLTLADVRRINQTKYPALKQ